jgi:hypothetical protein
MPGRGTEERMGVVDDLCALALISAAKRWIAPFRTPFPDVQIQIIDLIAERRQGRGPAERASRPIAR